jgi:recombination protein U
MIRKFNNTTHKSTIVNAFPVKQSKFVDFVGCSKTKPIAIEAKKTDLKTRFPFVNIEDTQYEFFKDWIACGGLGYYLIWFKKLDKTYLIKSSKIQEAKDTLERESIPIEWFQDTNNTIELGEDLEFIQYILKEK